MDPQIKNLIQLRKAGDDVKKTLGVSFLGVLSNVVNSLGGVNQAIKIAIGVMAAYKISTIVANVAIGISKTIAQFGVLGAPIALGMGAAALAAVLAIGAGSGIAINSLNNNTPPSTVQNEIIQNTDPKNAGISVIVHEDRFGKEIIQSSGGKKTKTQSNYGSSNN